MTAPKKGPSHAQIKIGKRFGAYKVLSKEKIKRKNGCMLMTISARCDCGTVSKGIYPRKLLKGETKGCRKCRRKRKKWDSRTGICISIPSKGMQIGAWTFLKAFLKNGPNKKKRRTVFLCQCTCGTKKELLPYLFFKKRMWGCRNCWLSSLRTPLLERKRKEHGARYFPIQNKKQLSNGWILVDYEGIIHQLRSNEQFQRVSLALKEEGNVNVESLLEFK